MSITTFPPPISQVGNCPSIRDIDYPFMFISSSIPSFVTVTIFVVCYTIIVFVSCRNSKKVAVYKQDSSGEGGSSTELRLTICALIMCAAELTYSPHMFYTGLYTELMAD